MAKPGKDSKPVPAAAAATSASGARCVLMIAISVGSAAVGALAMRIALQPQIDAALQGPSPTAPAATTPAGNVRPRPAAVPEPPPELTAGKAPAQAARAVGDYFYDHGDWLRAQQSYAAAIRDGSDDADIRTDYANAFHFSGRLDEAIEQYLIAQRMDALHEASRFNLGVLYAEAKREPAKAIAVWEEFLRRFPNSARAPAARDAIARLKSAATSPASAGAPVKPTGASDADLQRMMQHLQPAPTPAPAKP